MEVSTAVRYIYKKGVVSNTLFLHILFVDLRITNKSNYTYEKTIMHVYPMFGYGGLLGR